MLDEKMLRTRWLRGDSKISGFVAGIAASGTGCGAFAKATSLTAARVAP